MIIRSACVMLSVLVSCAPAQIAVVADGLDEAARAQASRAAEIAAGEAGAMWSIDAAGVTGRLTLYPDAAGYEAAEQSLPRDSADWIRAGDVVLQARAELERERDRN